MGTEFFQFLHSQPFFLIFGVVAIGMALGKVSIRGIALGSVVCIILAGLLVSIWSYNGFGIDLTLPDVLKTIFFNVFIFAVGLKIGPQFFAGLERDGWRMVAVGLTVAILAPILSYLCGWYFDLPQGAVAGLLAGSNNSSAAFGTANASTQSGIVHIRSGASLESIVGNLSAAFALCYTVSEIQFVLFMKLLPKMAGINPATEARAFEGTIRDQHSSPLPGTAEAGDVRDFGITVRAYRVNSTALVGRTLADIRNAAPRVSIERVRRADSWLTTDNTTKLEQGDELVVAAPLSAQILVRERMGPELDDAEARRLIPLRTVDVVVNRKEAVGRTLPDLFGTLGPGMFANAVFRAGQELPTGSETELKRGDVIRVTGAESHLRNLEEKVGQVVTSSHASDVLTLAIGLLIGAALGAIPVPLFGVRVSFGAAAILIAGIIFGWLKTRHPGLGGPISEGARRLLEEMGLNVFTAVLGINAGLSFFQVLKGGSLWPLVVSCLLISAIPALIAWWIGRHLLGLNPSLLMGAIAGARQNTASLRVAQQLSNSAVPAIGYPVPLAITTVTLAVAAYFFGAFL